MSATRYNKIAVILHWVIALLILFMFCLGWYMTDLPKKAPDQTSFDLFDLGIFSWQMSEPGSPRTFYFNLHKSIGLTILALVIVRVVWRFINKPPAPLAHYKAWEKKLATGMHHVLYLFMVAVPFAGIIMSTNSKYGIKWFGIDFLSGVDNKPAREQWAEIHEILAIVMLVVIVVHLLGALKHKFVDKDETMKRMSLF